MKYWIGFLRIFVGILFIVSGFVKLVDPIGFSFKLDEYFSPYVFNIPFLLDYTLYISVFLVVLEVMFGFFLVLGLYTNLVLSSLYALIIFFTFLTFYSAYFDKVTDCGCFGEALKLSPWQSFGKDFVLLIMLSFLIFGKKHIKPLFSNAVNLTFVSIIMIWSLFVPFRGIMGLPLIDFRTYKEGVNLKTEMKKEGKPDIFTISYQLTNKNTSENITVLDSIYIENEQYWEKDSPWVIKETMRTLVKRGSPPPIKDFDIDCGVDGIKTTEYLDEPFLVVFTSYGDKFYSQHGAEKLLMVKKELETMGIKVLDLTSGKLSSKSCAMDATTIKTMNRSNPGVTLMHNGIILKKYHWRSVPNGQTIADEFKGKVIE